ncbi:MAG: NAD(P)-dependent oxidoreductase [Chloroflexales bacterium]|nr:NAD(P)-dependent oxidoreductase [Chloroflexales bacterium]
MQEQNPIQAVAVIGLGRMGGPMALNLLRAGFTVSGYDLALQQRIALAEQGVTVADSIPEAVQDVDAIITMLPNDEAFQIVVEGVNGLLEQLQTGQIMIAMGTNKLATTQRVAALVGTRGGQMLDAPVSGGEQGARDGMLSIMVGGSRNTFTRCLPILETLGATVTYVGGSGMGLIAKLVNQMLMEASFCAIAEAFTMASQAGADLDAVYQAVRSGLGGSRALDWMLPQILSGDLGSGRELMLHHKDGAYALAAAELLGCWMPITQLTHELFDQALAAGQGGFSPAAVARVYEEQTGIKLIKKEEGG